MGDALKWAARSSSDIDTPEAGKVATFRDTDGSYRTKDENGNVEYLRTRARSLEKRGYESSVRGTATQSTSKSTAVTLNALTGTITLHNASLSANTTVSFTLNNSEIEADDLITVTHHSAGTKGAYNLNASATGTGTAQIDVRNVTAGPLGEAIVLKFKVEGA